MAGRGFQKVEGKRGAFGWAKVKGAVPFDALNLLQKP